MSVAVMTALLTFTPVTDWHTAPTPTTTTTTEQPTVYVVPPTASVWWRVAVCEEGGRNDPTYGYFGIYESSWLGYGGADFAPSPSGASFWEQVTVAERIDGSYVPDEYGCSSW